MSLKDNSLKLVHKNQSLLLKTPLAENRTFQAYMKAIELKCLSTAINNDDNLLWHY